MVQWRPFHPVTQRQVPFLHWPCCLHLDGVVKVVKVIHLVKVVKVFRVLMVEILPHLGSHSLLWQSCPVHP